MFIYDRDDSFNVNSFAVQIKNVCAFGHDIGTCNERRRSVSDILELRSSGKTHVKRSTEHNRFHCLGRIAGQARVAINAVYRQRAKTDARESVIEKEDARVSFVCALED